MPRTSTLAFCFLLLSISSTDAGILFEASRSRSPSRVRRPLVGSPSSLSTRCNCKAHCFDSHAACVATDCWDPCGACDNRCPCGCRESICQYCGAVIPPCCECDCRTSRNAAGGGAGFFLGGGFGNLSGFSSYGGLTNFGGFSNLGSFVAGGTAFGPTGPHSFGGGILGPSGGIGFGPTSPTVSGLVVVDRPKPGVPVDVPTNEANVGAVPEPSSIAIYLLGSIGIISIRRRRGDKG